MNIAHIAIWTIDLEAMKDFYTRYFDGESNEKYTNPQKQFESYFISFKGETKLELMHKKSVDKPSDTEERLGITHLAFNLGSKEAVISLTETLRSDGLTLFANPALPEMVILKALSVMWKETESNFWLNGMMNVFSKIR